MQAHGTLPVSDHTFLRTLDGVLIVQPEKLSLLDKDGLHDAAVPTPGALSGTVGGEGGLEEGKHEYVYCYLLYGGDESEPSPTLKVTVPDRGKSVTLTFPEPPNHPKLFQKLLFRKGPKDGIPLLIAELDVNTRTFVDDGKTQTARTPTQGLRAMPGGRLGIIQNRRLFVVNGDTLHYSYAGSYAYSNVFWTEKLNLPTGESVRAICPLGSGLVFFGLETALFMNGTPSEGGTFSPIPVPDGCVGPQAWTQAEDGTLFYVGKSGVYAMNGVQAQRISDPLNDIFRDLSVGQISNSTLIYDQQQRRLLVSLPNQILAYYFTTRSWSVWTLSGAELDWFEGRINMYMQGQFGILGEASDDNGKPIEGKFVSGVLGLDDPVYHKLFRRIGLQVTATTGDTVDLYIRTFDHAAKYSGLPDTEVKGSIWGSAIWGKAQWAGSQDAFKNVSLPDSVQGRYIQITVTFKTQNAGRFVLMGPLVIEYRPTYRYGRS